ncbi:DUF892 family protein [Mucilaginibacter sp. Bleaf8]|uniref:DUF892 family protein n=1 Tax=Mucilaginibacter sp. Bleaf8 TaxID=2834430 RepID=UPI001BCFB9FC|nr:DUF892 family protein [Mucilaginibacter sp. Bleaf8]MBS7565185.1 DUF892 family protein [Mucilaginibacter sp. Bleaf8]
MEAQTTLVTDPAALQQHFVHHLNRIYYGKSYLQQHFPSLIALCSLKKLKQGIQELVEDVSRQVERLHEIYRLIDMQPATEQNIPIIAVFKDAFEPKDDVVSNPLLTDIDILLYLQLIEHINVTSYRMLKVLAAKLGYKEVEQLLLESFDEASDDYKLLSVIADEYISK